MVVLRPAQRDDCDFVWRINNATDVREQSVSRAPIPLGTHRRWYLTRMWAELPLLWIVNADGVDVGVVRGDVVGTRATISIALDPAHRGRGIGRQAILTATRLIFWQSMVHAVTATIRGENVASQRAFAAAGYGRLDGDPDAAAEGLLTFAFPPPHAADHADVLFRCDGGTTVGWGHATRCLALASALHPYGFVSRFAMQAPDPRLVALLTGAGHAVQVLPDGDDLAATIAAGEASGARVLVLDSCRHDAAWLAAVRAAIGCAHVVIDDLADRVLPCEVIVNANPGAEQFDYTAYGAEVVLAGPRFALLRREFTPGLRPDRAGLLDRRVLVTLGGSKLGEQALRIAQAIAEAPGVARHTTLLVGGDADLVARAHAFAARDPGWRRTLVGADEVAHALSATRLAVSAAGHTCFELAALGVPALLVVGAPNQQPGARAWCDAGAFGMLGEIGGVTPAEVARRVLRTLEDEEWLASSAARASELVDGNGAGRVADLIAAVLEAV